MSRTNTTNDDQGLNPKPKLLYVVGIPIIILGLVVFMPGCPNKGNLKGVVTVEGEPMASGSVVLVPSDMRPLTTIIEKDGSYLFKGVPTGPSKLAVYNAQRGRRFGGFFVGGGGGNIQISMGGGNNKTIKINNSPKEGGEERKAPPVAPEYATDPDKSGLKYEIRNGNNEYNLDLKE